MKQPLVSVIIPNYNYGRYLGDAIESALGQTYPNVEVIVVDDGSKDDSVNVARTFGDRIKLVVQDNGGVSAARNRGIQEAGGELIAFLDSDDVWLPEKLERQVGLFEEAEIGLVHCGYVEFNTEGNLGHRHTEGLEGDVAVELLRFRQPVILGGGSAAVVRRSLLETVGGFDPDVSGAEDWEFYYRCARASRVGFVPEVLLKYREHQNNAHLNIPKMERAILGAFDKAFSADEGLAAIRRICYGKIHSVLAGSYFRAGMYPQFLLHSLRSIWLSPVMIGHYLRFPVRAARRLTKMKAE